MYKMINKIKNLIKNKNTLIIPDNDRKSIFHRTIEKNYDVDLEYDDYLKNIEKICLSSYVIKFKINGKAEKLKSIEVKTAADGFSGMTVKEDVLYTNSKYLSSILVLYPCDKEGESFAIPNEVKKIQSNAFFDCNHLKKIIFNNKKIIIEKDAFRPIEKYNYDFISLLNIEESDDSLTVKQFDKSVENFLNEFTKKGLELFIPEKINGTIVDKLGSKAFSNIKSLRKVCISKNIKNIAFDCFLGCDNLTEIVIDENNPYLKYENGIIYTKDGKKVIAVVENIVTALEEIKLPSSLEEYGNLFMKQDIMYNNFVIENSNIFETIDGVLYSKNGEILLKYPNASHNESFNCPKSVKIIDKNAFVNVDNLKTVILPKSITSIGYMAFENCARLNNINIPENINVLELINKNVFQNCPNIYMKLDAKYSKNLNYAYDSKNNSYTCVKLDNCIDEHIVVPSIYEGKFVYDVSIKNSLNRKTKVLQFLEGIREISIDLSYLTNECNIEKIIIPNSAESISILCNGCEQLTDIYVSENNKNYKSVDGVLYTKDGKSILAYPSGKKDKIYKILDGVEIIEESIFKNNSNLEKIIMPNTVIEIKKGSFLGMENLNAVYLSKNIETIGDLAFNNCEKLNYINLSGKYNLKSIGDSAFAYCPIVDCKFKDFDYEDFFYNTNVKVVDERGDWNWYSLKFESKLEYIGKRAFSNCQFIGEVSMMYSNRYANRLVIEEHAFEDCKLGRVELHGNVEIRTEAFKSAFEIEETMFEGDEIDGGCVYFNEGYPIISKKAFKGCTNLKIYFHEKKPNFEYEIIISPGQNAEMFWDVDFDETF